MDRQKQKTAGLDPDLISEPLAGGRTGRKVIVYSSTSSTSDVAWQYSSSAGNDGLAIFAEHQSKGRGRHGRKWEDETGKSLLGSVLLKELAGSPDMVTLTAAVAVAEAVAETAAISPRIKWPNDIIAGGRKLAGILIESRRGRSAAVRGRVQFDYVIGVGINCNQDRGDIEAMRLDQPATSIYAETARIVDRNRLAGIVLGCLDKWLDTAKRQPEAVSRKWQNLSSQLGSRLTISCDNRIYRGTCIGIDPAQGLIVQLENGGVSIFPACQSSIEK